MDMKKVINRYNSIMFALCLEHCTIGTRFSESTDGWNLRDMVSEMQYHLDMYNDPDCTYWEEAHAPTWEQGSDRPWYKQWVRDKGYMERFINRYKEEALKMECVEGHCSIYD